MNAVVCNVSEQGEIDEAVARWEDQLDSLGSSASLASMCMMRDSAPDKTVEAYHFLCGAIAVRADEDPIDAVVVRWAREFGVDEGNATLASLRKRRDTAPDKTLDTHHFLRGLVSELQLRRLPLVEHEELELA